MTPGIFSNWDVSGLLEKPENIFKKNLQKNPVYPFEEICPNVYVLTVKSARFGIGLLLCIIMAVGTISIFSTVESIADLMEIVVFPLFVIIGFIIQTYAYRHDRTYILDNNEKMYEFYRGNKLVYRGHFHNIYIRLKGQNSGSGVIYYSVVLNGFQLDEEELTGSTKRHKKLNKLGRRLAHRLDLNFFDWRDKGRTHTIRHRCPYREKSVV